MKKLLGLILITSCATSHVFAQQSVGFEQSILYPESNRPLRSAIWYPTEEFMPREKIAENVAFKGTNVIRLSRPTAGKYPVAVLSHGYRGNWRNENWLATMLAQSGYVVLAVDHPGSTSFDSSPKAAAQWWQRPKDISRSLDWLFNSSRLQTFINKDDVTAIGHSLGGWTVMALAGAQFDRDQLKQEYKENPNPRITSLTPELGFDTPQIGEATSSLKDDRIKRVVSMDLGLARGFSKQSLKDLHVPSLILGAGVDIGDLPQAQESGFLAQYIPKSRQTYIVYRDAAHFSFMQLCKPGAEKIIEEENPGDGIVCQDGGMRSREQLHDVIFKDIQTFISQS